MARISSPSSEAQWRVTTAKGVVFPRLTVDFSAEGALGQSGHVGEPAEKLWKSSDDPVETATDAGQDNVSGELTGRRGLVARDERVERALDGCDTEGRVTWPPVLWRRDRRRYIRSVFQRSSAWVGLVDAAATGVHCRAEVASEFGRWVTQVVDRRTKHW